MKALFRFLMAAACVTLAGQASAQITFSSDGRYTDASAPARVTIYEREGFQGRSFTTQDEVPNFRRTGFEERASSAIVEGGNWEVCDDNRFRGRCMVLRPGRYASLAEMGLSDRISSARVLAQNNAVAGDRYPHASGAGQLSFFEEEGFAGRSFVARGEVENLQRTDFNDRASSAVVIGERWEVCSDAGFRGRCVVLRPGRYGSLAAMGLNDRVSSARLVAANTAVTNDRMAPEPGPGQVNLFENENFGGRSVTSQGSVDDLRASGFNDRASSVVVVGDRWEVCEDSGYRGRCKVLRPGRYASLGEMGLNDRISSVRAVDWNARVSDDRYAPVAAPVYDSRPRRGEQLYQANVTSSRAVVATSGQRCWVESEQVPQERSNANVPAAIAGALLGGVLGHQVGGGTGKDLATVGGAVAGAAIGANVGRGGGTAAQDVQRCEAVPGGARPAYWDVSYDFRGQSHRIQMATAPGRTITVNERGEPRQ